MNTISRAPVSGIAAHRHSSIELASRVCLCSEAWYLTLDLAMGPRATWRMPPRGPDERTDPRATDVPQPSTTRRPQSSRAPRGQGPACGESGDTIHATHTFAKTALLPEITHVWQAPVRDT